MKLGVSPAASTPTGVFSQWFEALFSHAGTLAFEVCHQIQQLLPPWPAAALPILLHSPPPHWVHQPPPCFESSPPSCPSPPLLPVWVSFCFISMVVRLLYSLIFCQFWLFFVFKLLLSFFWLCEEAQCVYLCLHFGWKYLHECSYQYQYQSSWVMSRALQALILSLPGAWVPPLYFSALQLAAAAASSGPAPRVTSSVGRDSVQDDCV